MTRSEEELVVGSRVREVGRVRLRKRIVTEDVTVTVRKEVVGLEQEAITDGDVIDTVVWPEAPEVACEMVRFEEEVVIEKRIVPKERVRLVKTVVVEHETVTGDVRKEQIQLEGDAAPRRD
jgi:stress response protein YsnF